MKNYNLNCVETAVKFNRTNHLRLFIKAKTLKPC